MKVVRNVGPRRILGDQRRISLTHNHLSRALKEVRGQATIWRRGEIMCKGPEVGLRKASRPEEGE